jgi:hypothetical protein
VSTHSCGPTHVQHDDGCTAQMDVSAQRNTSEGKRISPVGLYIVQLGQSLNKDPTSTEHTFCRSRRRCAAMRTPLRARASQGWSCA